ncbi:MAG TPA: DUF6582 domain-containing protein, partial [Candidatus Limnocylindrales bacterium]
MGITTAASKLPPLKPGEFRFVTNGLQIEMEPAGPDAKGRRRFKAIASSTAKDLRGDEMQMSAMEDMVAAFRRGLNVFMDHEHTAQNIFGRTDSAEIRDSGQIDPRNGARIWDLHVAGTVNEPNKKAMELADSIDGGYVSFGTSIGAFITKFDKKKDGGRSIEHVNCKELSVVGLPMQERAWTYKSANANWTKRAADATATMEQNALFDGEDPEGLDTFSLDTESTPEVIEPSQPVLEAEKAADEPVLDEKAEMSAKTRNDLPATEFACPEKRKYPINDAAHVRAALSRVADPNNDQCGKDKILAAAKRMGIGEAAEKGLSDEDLLVWAATDPEMLRNAASICGECGHDASCACTDCDCGSHVHTGDTDNDGDDPAHGNDPDMDGKAADLALDTKSDTTTGGQEASEAIPETAPAAEPEPDPAPEQKALAFETADVVTLVGHVRNLT